MLGNHGIAGRKGHIVTALTAYFPVSSQHSAVSIQLGPKRRSSMKDFRDLQVWQKAHRLTLAAYSSTSTFPREEMYGLTSQIRRCAASIAANIAEGCGKRGNPEFQRFLNIASGSASELEYHVLLARDLGLLNDSDYDKLDNAVVEVKRMLASLVRKVEADRRAG
jgi:four helix bundle protein